MYGLSEADRLIQDTARDFVDSLIPLELEAELAGGQLPKEVTAEHHGRAIDLGLFATNMPTSVGGAGGAAPRCNRYWCRSSAVGPPTDSAG